MALIKYSLLTSLVFSLFQIILPSSAHAAPTDYQIEVQGNERTKDFYIKSLTQECIEQNLEIKDPADLKAADLEQCLMNSKIFSEVKVVNQGTNIGITVKDRWTLIPIPAASVGSGGNSSFGVFLLESNFVGMGMTLVLGAASSNLGSTYFAMISDRSLFFTPWFYNVSISSQAQEIYQKDEEGDTDIDGFRERADSQRLTLGYRWNRTSLAGFVLRKSSEYKYLDAFSYPDDNLLGRGGLTLGYDNRNFRLYFSEGFSSVLNAQRDAYRTDDEDYVQQLDLQLNWQIGMFGDHALQLAFNGGALEGGSKGDLFRLGGGTGFRGIETATVWVDEYYTASADYQIPLKTFKSGTLTVAPFVDLGRLSPRGRERDYTDYYSAGAGIYYFLKEIAIPGIGFQVGYNEKFLGNFFAVSVGLSR